ncbi:spore germination protein [Tissierella creatinini]|nr:spore germination protein [Tissierella creatinini]TJX60878.1 spore germination protein [Soehngenia saccharolytica]
MLRNVSRDIEITFEYIKERFKDCDDLIYRRLEVGRDYGIKLIFIMIDGLAGKTDISDFSIENLVFEGDLNVLGLEHYKEKILNYFTQEGISNFDIKEEKDIELMLNSIMSGDTVLLVDGLDTSIIIDSKGWSSRSISEPVTEAVIRGPRDGFTENLRTNTALVRRRIKDTRFKIRGYSVGRRSKTNVALMYIEDIVNDKLLDEVKKRILEIDIDGIVDSSILEHLIEDNYLSVFPQVENTERPDSVAASLLEGRVALIVDNSPFALIVPATLGTLLQSSEDHYNRWIETSVVRIIRVIAVLTSILGSAIYISVISYQPGLLPSTLLYYIAANRVNVPFPAVIEAGLMEITMEIIRQAGTRISGPIGSTVGIVGGLIIGQAAVEAGIVSNLMIIVVALTTICSFAIPSYELASALRVYKFAFIVLAGVLGLYGIMIGIILLGSHLIVLNSFGIPFSSPYSGLGIEEGDLKDTIVKAPLQRLWMRPGFTHPKDKRRMGRVKRDE